MEGRLNMTNSIGDDVFVPMMRRKNLRVADRFEEVFQFVTGG